MNELLKAPADAPTVALVVEGEGMQLIANCTEIIMRFGLSLFAPCLLSAGMGKTALAVEAMRLCGEKEMNSIFCFADVSDQRPFSAYLGLLKKVI